MFIDLTVPLNENTPVYPGDPKTSIKPAGILSRVGFCDHYISVGTHVGTHIDAPMHMLEGGKSLDQISISQFIGNGRYVRVKASSFDAVKVANIKEGDIVLFHTGMAERYYEPEYFEDYPAMTEEIAEYLVKSKIKMVGFDTCSADNVEGFPIHKILLAGNVLITENLTNLEQLDEKVFKVYALPLNLQIEGSPARVVAELKL